MKDEIIAISVVIIPTVAYMRWWITTECDATATESDATDALLSGCQTEQYKLCMHAERIVGMPLMYQHTCIGKTSNVSNPVHLLFLLYS